MFQDGDTIRQKYKSSNSFTYDEIKNNLLISDLCKRNWQSGFSGCFCNQSIRGC